MAFVYEEAKSACTLYNGIGQIEYDESSGGIGYEKGTKIMGPVQGCLPCYRAGWDYVMDSKLLKIFHFKRFFLDPLKVTNGSGANMQGMGFIESVPDVFSCAKICAHVNDCAIVSYQKNKRKCYLKTQDGYKVN